MSNIGHDISNIKLSFCEVGWTMSADLIELLDKWKCWISNIYLKLFTVRPVMRLPMMMVIKNIMRIMMIWTITGKAFPIPVEGT